MSVNAMEQKWFVSQIGRREDYCLPRALFRRGCLRRLYTDCWVSRGHGILKRLPRQISDLQNRFNPELRSAPVHAFTGRFTLGHLGRIAAGWPKGHVELRRHNLRVGKRYDRLVADWLRRERVETGGIVAGFTSAALDTMSVARQRGWLPMLDQIDPALTELRILREEVDRWPDWELRSDAGDEEPAEYWDRVREEWKTAQLIIVNSDFSRRALIEQGVADSKIIVLPLAFESSGRPVGPRPVNRKLQVLWVGSVILRKGIQYLLSAAKALQNADVEFVVAGPIGIELDRTREFPNNVRFLGKVTHERKLQLFEQSDVFILPTLAEGFAITQVEAMSHGLPVITTPNCGDVVDDGVNGYIVPIRDSDSIAERILQLKSDGELLRAMSAAALVKSKKFTLDGYGQRLVDLVQERLNGFRAESMCA